VREAAYQRSADVGRSHATDSRTHGGRAQSDIANFSRKQFARVDVDAWERYADEHFAEHCKRHRRRMVVYTYRAVFRQCGALGTVLPARPLIFRKK